MEPQIAELFFRTVLFRSVLAYKQLSIYGGVAHWCSSQQVQATDMCAEPQSEFVPHDHISCFTKHETWDTSVRHSQLEETWSTVMNNE